MVYVLPKLALVSSLFMAGAVPIVAQESYFTNWPTGSSPKDVGKRLAEHFVTSPHQYGETIHYSEVATWYGALTFSQLTHDDALRGKLIKRFEPLMPDGAESSRIPTRRHVDDSIFGIVPLEIAIVAAGMAEMLRDLPADHPQRARIMRSYKAMMAALLKYQGKDGMWRELIDHEEAWAESSSSAMFDFAMIIGVKNGWLDAKTYGPAARRGWIAVAGYIDQNNDVTSVCEGTGKQNDLQYYLARKRRTGDFHGQAAVLWAASALLR